MSELNSDHDRSLRVDTSLAKQLSIAMQRANRYENALRAITLCGTVQTRQIAEEALNAPSSS
jgi:hypothetical protein